MTQPAPRLPNVRMLSPSCGLFVLVMAVSSIGSAGALTPAQTPPVPLALVEPINQVNIGTTPPERLMAGYQSMFYQRSPLSGAVTLTTGSMRPHAPHDPGPVTLLKETQDWALNGSPASMTAVVDIDHLPKHGDLIIGRLVSRDQVIASLETDGNRVAARVGTHYVTIGAITPETATRRITYTIRTTPDSTLHVTANGTQSVFPLPTTTGPVHFEATAGETLPFPPDPHDYARDTFQQITITHG